MTSRLASPLSSLLLIAFLLLVFLGMSFLLPGWGSAHEQWVLTAEKVAELNAQPLPRIFTEINTTNVSMIIVTVVFLMAWVLLGFTGARELFPDLQIRLASYGGFAALALRIGLAIMLGMAAFGLAPRAGTDLFETPALGAPDLELRLLPDYWGWIAWVEAAVAFAFLLGIYVRGTAALTLALSVLGLALFREAMLAYIGLVGGAAIYLVLQGAGSFYVPMPEFPGTKRISQWLADQPRQRAQVLLRVLAGLNLVYLGIAYKFLQPNLAVEMIVTHHVPTFGLEPATFVLWMALVETLSGLLILAGILIRPLAVFLFITFLFFSFIMGENVFSHIIFYALLVSFATNAAGRWRRPAATDKPGEIVILGGGFAGVHCALRLERLLGEYTNVGVTLVHRESYFQFDPLLPEVVGGTVQPGNIVNPIRRICPRMRFFQATVASLNHQACQVELDLVSGEKRVIGYDQLVIALDQEADFSGIPGLLEQALPMMTIGDALFLRQRIVECLEKSETIDEPDHLRGNLTFAVVGGGLRGCSTAVEIRRLIDSALISYRTTSDKRPQVLLFEQADEVLPQFGSVMGASVRLKLSRSGVGVFTKTSIVGITPEDIVLSSDRRIPCHTLVGTLARQHKLLSSLPGAGMDGRIPVDEYLRAKDMAHVFLVGNSASTGETVPFSAIREIRMGRLAAYNALACIQGLKLLTWRERKPLMYLAALGRRATVWKVFGILIGGIPAWVASRFLCMLTLPGLERNLRILIDWVLDIPFRNDIVVLAPQRTTKVCQAHYECGDTIFLEGDKGDCAYIIVSGEVEVVKTVNGHMEHVATLGEGDSFGEIALLREGPRTATVKCLTSVELTVLPREQFKALESDRELGEKLNARMAQRLSELESFASKGAASERSTQKRHSDVGP